MDQRSFFICHICQNILNDPYYLPCHCLVCKHHLDKKRIECKSCNKIFSLPHEGIKENSQLKILIENDAYLTEEEKRLKQAMKNSTLFLEELFKKFQNREREFDTLHTLHFKKLEDTINDRYERMVKQLVEIKDELHEKLKESRKNYQDKLALNRPFGSKDDFKNVIDTFKNPNLHSRNAEQIYAKLEHSIELIKTRIEAIDLWEAGLVSYQLSSFKSEKKYLKQMYGILKLKSTFIKTESFEEPSKTELSPPIIPNAEPQCKQIKLIDANQSNLLSNIDIKPILVNSEFIASKVRRRRRRNPFSFFQREYLESFYRNETSLPNLAQIDEISKKLNLSSLKLSLWFQKKRYQSKFVSVKKRNRIVKSNEQVRALELAYEKSKKPKKCEIKKLAHSVNLPEQTVYQWFTNTRNAEKKKNEIVLD